VLKFQRHPPVACLGLAQISNRRVFVFPSREWCRPRANVGRRVGILLTALFVRELGKTQQLGPTAIRKPPVAAFHQGGAFQPRVRSRSRHSVWQIRSPENNRKSFRELRCHRCSLRMGCVQSANMDRLRINPAPWASRLQPAPIPRLRPGEDRTTAFPRSGCTLRKRASAGWA